MDWLNIVQTLGVSVAMLAFIGWCSIQVARWIAPRIDKLAERVFAAADRVETFDERVGKLEQQVETLWNYLLRRAQVEVVSKGLGSVNSPLIINDEARSWLASMTDDLRDFYRRCGPDISKIDLLIGLERTFGQRMVEEVCMPHGIYQGSCLLIAAHVATDGKFESLPEKKTN